MNEKTVEELINELKLTAAKFTSSTNYNISTANKDIVKDRLVLIYSTTDWGNFYMVFIVSDGSAVLVFG